jgi:hypothetical protein
MAARTAKQNDCLHKYFRLLAESLNAAGLDMRKVMKPEWEIPWTEEMVKAHLWKPVQDVMLDKESTTELSTTDVDAVYQVVSRHLAEKHGISVAFPSHFTQGAA